MTDRTGRSNNGTTRRNIYYVDGSTVRKIDQAPDKIEREYEERKRQVRRPSAKAIHKAEKALAFDVKYTVFLTTMIILMICASVNLLRMEAKINSQNKNISQKENQLEQLEDQNNAYENSLNNKYNLNEIYTVATQELGMVYAKKGQVMYYDSANEDYVKQYQDVPGVE